MIKTLQLIAEFIYSHATDSVGVNGPQLCAPIKQPLATVATDEHFGTTFIQKERTVNRLISLQKSSSSRLNSPLKRVT